MTPSDYKGKVAQDPDLILLQAPLRAVRNGCEYVEELHVEFPPSSTRSGTSGFTWTQRHREPDRYVENGCKWWHEALTQDIDVYTGDDYDIGRVRVV